MKNLKKFLALFMVAAMTFSFVACSSKSDKDKDKDKDKDNDKNVEDSNDKDDKDNKDDAEKDERTAMEILESISMEDITSGELNFILNAEGSMDMEKMFLDSGVTEDEIQDAIDSGEIDEDYLNMVLSVKMDFVIEADDDYSHTVGSLEMEALGESETEYYESYVDYSNDEYSIKYDYDDYYEEWTATKESTDDAEEDITEDISMILEYVKNAEILSETDDAYVISAEVDLLELYEDESESVDDLVDDSDVDVEDFVGDLSDLFGSFGSLEFTVEVDKETNYLTAISCDLVDVVDDILSVIPESEDGVNYADYITVDEFSLSVEISNIDNVEVEIPQEVIDEVGEATEEDDEWDDFEDDDEDVVVSGEDTFVLYDYYDDVVATMNVPEGYELDVNYSEDTLIKIKSDYGSVYVQNFIESWAGKLISGEEYVVDTEFYTRDDIEELESVETDLGTIRVFIRTYSYSENYDEIYYQSIIYALVEDGDAVFSIDGEVDEIEASGYTIETFIQAMLQQ